jgi:hypothetical protein
MERFQTAQQLSGRAIGSLFFSAFGALWIGLSLYIRQELTVSTGLSVGLILLALLAACLWLLRASRRYPKTPEDPAVSKAFQRINVAQWVLVALVNFAFNQLHWDAFALSATTAIVGLHLLPLARLFRYSPHYITGSVLLLWGAATSLLIPVDQLQGVTAMGTGLILWSSAASTLTLTVGNAVRTPEMDPNPRAEMQL